MRDARRVLYSAIAGIFAGFFFGDLCAYLAPIGDAYVMLLQAAVYPYVIASLLHGLGSLSPVQSSRLFRHGWSIYVLAWVLVFGALLAGSYAIPSVEAPVAAPRSGAAVTDTLSFVIPRNFVNAITKNYVPAVIVFCVLYGIALQRVENKEGLLSGLAAVRTMSLRFWGWVVRFVPLAIFVLIADTVGTVSFADLEQLGFFLFLWVGIATILALWMLPAVIAATTALTYREVLSGLRSAFVVAIGTTLSVSSLPYIAEFARELAERFRLPEVESKEVVETNLSIAYVFGQLGNFFVLLFMIFVGYFFQQPETFQERILLPFMTFLSCLGSPTATVNGVAFLSSWLGFPPGAPELYVEVLALVRYAMLLVSVAGFGFLSALVTLAYFGRLQVRPVKLLVAIILPLVAIGGLAVGLRNGQRIVFGEERRPYLYFTLDPKVTAGVDREILKGPRDTSLAMPTTRSAVDVAEKDRQDHVLTRIRERGELRVGYNAGIIPFCYVNAKGDLVGYDVEAAFSLARSLNVKLVLIPFEWERLTDDLVENRFDIAMAGIYVTDQRLQNLEVSSPYFSSPVALFGPREKIENYSSRAKIEEMPDLRIGVFRDPVLVPLVSQVFPHAKVVLIQDYDVLPDFDEVDVAIWTREQAAAIASAHPGIQAIVPTGIGTRFLFAYPMPNGASSWRQYVDYWLEIRRKTGASTNAESYWLKGSSRRREQRRWSILRDVLHWSR